VKFDDLYELMQNEGIIGKGLNALGNVIHAPDRFGTKVSHWARTGQWPQELKDKPIQKTQNPTYYPYRAPRSNTPSIPQTTKKKTASVSARKKFKPYKPPTSTAPKTPSTTTPASTTPPSAPPGAVPPVLPAPGSTAAPAGAVPPVLSTSSPSPTPTKLVPRTTQLQKDLTQIFGRPDNNIASNFLSGLSIDPKTVDFNKVFGALAAKDTSGNTPITLNGIKVDNTGKIIQGNTEGIKQYIIWLQNN